MSGAVRRDLRAFRPNLVHVSSPDPLGHRAVAWARRHGLPAVASVHTRFETYPRYYGLAFLEPVIESLLHRFYRRCEAIVRSEEHTSELQSHMRTSYAVFSLQKKIYE